MTETKSWLNEDEVLKRAIQGDSKSLEVLVKMHKNLAYTIAIKIAGNKEDAEEIVQDAFMKAFASLAKFKGNSKFSTWLYRIVYNTAITRVRQNRVVTVDVDEVPKFEQHHFAATQEGDLLNGADRKKYINLALDKLSDEERIIITLHYMAEKSISEICEILGQNKSAIKMRLLRARKGLESELKLLLDNEIIDII